MSGRRRWLSVGGVCLGLAGCYGKGEPYTEPATTACEPLVAVEAPIGLGAVLGIGEAADGTLYLMDRTDLSLRVFVSRDSEFFRARVSGEGTVYDDGGETNLATFESGMGDLTLGVEMSDGTTRVALGPPGLRSFDALLTSGEELSVVPESVLDDYALRNLPGDVEIEYVAGVETGERIVVIRPVDDWTLDDFRLFLGVSERLVERQVRSVVRARDGGSTSIRFDLNGEAAELSFPVADPASLTTGTGTYSVEPLATETVTSFSFECLESRVRPNSASPDAGT